MSGSEQSAPVRIAVMQARGVPGEPRENLVAIESAAVEAMAAGARLLVTPEMFLTGYNIGGRIEELVDRTPVGLVAELARRVGIALAVGMPFREPDGIRNGVALVGPDGRVVVRYDKTHLFGALDRALFVQGDRIGPVVDFHGVRIGFLICYDVEFPETVRRLALLGADLVIVPTAQMEPYAFIAERLIGVRAWESQVYVAYANRVGSEGDLGYVGRSIVAAPDGTALAVGSADLDELLIADIDPTAVRRGRSENPYLADRRLDLSASGPVHPARWRG